MSLWDEPARQRPGDPGTDWTQGAPTAAPAPAAPQGGAPDDAVAVARPPVGWLAAALAVALVAVLLVLLVARPVPGVPLAGWLLAGPVGVSLLALFTRRDVLARTRPVYAAPGWVRPAYVVVSVLVVLAVAVTAWRLADWVGRL